jgi:dTDP-4-amino-4,6-dideoxygalactose transaminase
MATSDAAAVENHAPSFDRRDLEAVAAAIESGWVSYAGASVSAFEREVASAMGFPGAVAMSSGTCALQIAFELLDAPGTDVCMPALTFAAPASAAVRAHLSPVFIDVAGDTCQLDPDLVRDFLETACERRDDLVINRRTGRRVSTLCIVHLWGGLADLDALHEIAAEYKLHVVHDAAQCFGALHRGQPFGRACGIGGDAHGLRVVAATSFNANKIITTGGGGAFLASDPALVQRARHISSTAKVGRAAFEHDAYGLNYRMSNINAALGLAQIAKLAHFTDCKRANHELYASRLAIPDLDVRFPADGSCVTPNFWSSCARLPIDADPVIRRMQSRNIQVRPVWIPLPQLAIYARFPYVRRDDVSRQIWRRGVMLPSGPALAAPQIERVIDELRECLR